MRRLFRPCEYIGRRGSALLFFAFLDGVIGESLIDTPPVKGVAEGPIFRLFSLTTWGWMWLTVAAVCLVTAFWKKSLMEQAAFGLASWIKIMWAAGYIGLAFESHVYRSYVGAAIWIAFALLVQLIAGWPETTRK